MLIFVYGTLKLGFPNHRCLGASQLMGTHVTEPRFTMFSCGGFPAVSPVGNTAITGEVYEVSSPSDRDRVFNLEGYTGQENHPSNWYDTQSIQTEWGEAKIFIFKNPPTDLPVVENGIWEKNPRYGSGR